MQQYSKSWSTFVKFLLKVFYEPLPLIIEDNFEVLSLFQKTGQEETMQFRDNDIIFFNYNLILFLLLLSPTIATS